MNQGPFFELGHRPQDRRYPIFETQHPRTDKRQPPLRRSAATETEHIQPVNDVVLPNYKRRRIFVGLVAASSLIISFITLDSLANSHAETVCITTENPHQGAFGVAQEAAPKLREAGAKIDDLSVITDALNDTIGGTAVQAGIEVCAVQQSSPAIRIFAPTDVFLGNQA